MDTCVDTQGGKVFELFPNRSKYLNDSDLDYFQK